MQVRRPGGTLTQTIQQQALQRLLSKWAYVQRGTGGKCEENSIIPSASPSKILAMDPELVTSTAVSQNFLPVYLLTGKLNSGIQRTIIQPATCLLSVHFMELMKLMTK